MGLAKTFCHSEERSDEESAFYHHKQKADSSLRSE
jgi:hypothetical protein